MQQIWTIIDTMALIISLLLGSAAEASDLFFTAGLTTKVSPPFIDLPTASSSPPFVDLPLPHHHRFSSTVHCLIITTFHRPSTDF